MSEGRRKFLYGSALLPLAVGPITLNKAEQIWSSSSSVTPIMHYIWSFSWADDDYVPIGVYNTREEADKVLEEIRKKVTMTNGFSGAVISSTWSEFVSMATRTKLGRLAESLEKLGLKV